MVTHGLQTGESVIPFCLRVGYGLAGGSAPVTDKKLSDTIN